MEDRNSQLVFTIIIIAYNRRTFISDSVRSVLSQNFPRENYEIIVSKNFEDIEIDRFLLQNDVKIIMNEKPGIGQRLNECILKSRGRIIAFLEDDDSWVKDRLSIVLDVYNANKQLGYYHNSYIPVNDAGKTTKEWIHHKNIRNTSYITGGTGYGDVLPSLMRFSPDFNISSICISKELAVKIVGNLSKLSTAIDLYFFLTALEFNFDLFLDERRLTRYMIHQSNMDKSGTFPEFILASLKVYREDLESTKYIHELLNNKNLKRIASSYSLEWEIRINLLQGRGNRREMLRSIFSRVELFFYRRDHSKYFFPISLLSIIFPVVVRRGYYFYLKNSLLKYKK